jgi:hypothetical protein
MPVARLLATLVLVSASAFAQKQSDPFTGSTPAAESRRSEQGKPSEPWRIIPNRPADSGRARNAIDRLRTDEFKAFQFKPDGHARIASYDADSVSRLPGQLEADTTCYTIRSYVVARDDEDSDSTHPVGSSTCQPTSRYRVKNAQAYPGSSDR